MLELDIYDSVTTLTKKGREKVPVRTLFINDRFYGNDGLMYQLVTSWVPFRTITGGRRFRYKAHWYLALHEMHELRGFKLRPNTPFGMPNYREYVPLRLVDEEVEALDVSAPFHAPR